MCGSLGLQGSPASLRRKVGVGRKVYMDYNATTPLEPEVIRAMTEAMQEAWGNPSSPYPAADTAVRTLCYDVPRLTPQRLWVPLAVEMRGGCHCGHSRKAKEIINAARENLAKMIGGRPQDMIFTSGGTEVNSLNKVTFVPVSKVNGQAEAEDILAAVRPATCLVTIMLANNETGVIMPVPEISRRVRALNQQRAAGGLPGVLVHTDAAQALGKQRVDVRDLGVDFLTVVGHKFYGPRIGALYIRGLGELTPLYPMLFGGGQERNFRPGTENTPMIAGLGKERSPFPLRGLCLECPSPLPRVPVTAPTCRSTVVTSSLAAELVAENCEAYEAHMRDVRDYLEERLAVSARRGAGGAARAATPDEGLHDPQRGAPDQVTFSQAHDRKGPVPWDSVRWYEGGGLPTCSRGERQPPAGLRLRGPVLCLLGRLVLAQCRTLLASMGAACHSDHGDRPSPVLLSCGVPLDVARNAIRLSVGRGTTRAEVDLVVQDLKQAVARLEGQA
ncbi:hypothetical protein E2I00_000762 [Balaenoptera physalus]|uniref:Selenocysteine lyase n=1 Tax=Balaenoptera physalus TaxID=9770 RepID=A0A6A1QI95_BALPH|nr:hypothetical protein E2I00_000762 [Balaenoptera physalus]